MVAPLHPTMSVVICASGDRYVARARRCLDSVRRQFGVRHEDIDIVFMIAQRPEDAEGSSKLEKLAAAYEAAVVKETYEAPGYNYAFARNVAARHCTGQVLCFLDADTILDCETFRNALERITSKTFILVPVSYTHLTLPTN